MTLQRRPSDPVDPEDRMVLTSTEIYSRAKELICRTWVVPPLHPWYFQRHPGSAISFKGSRSYQTAFYWSPEHILQCLGFSCEEAVTFPLLLLDFVQIYVWAHRSSLVSLDQMGIRPTTATAKLTNEGNYFKMM
ncbi:uncharacterized protein TNCV_147871 [Trichonephila clavipes]|nr:uncharacterized protein TNCV_147871 [Trichonephila clavipes]